jgi:hypothetical protein
MSKKDEKQTNTDILLGKVAGELSGVKTQMASQEQSLNGVKEGLSEMAREVRNLPCQKHEDDINYLLKCNNEGREAATYGDRSRREKLRDLLIALAAAVITGGFTLLGVWLSGNHVLSAGH